VVSDSQKTPVVVAGRGLARCGREKVRGGRPLAGSARGADDLVQCVNRIRKFFSDQAKIDGLEKCLNGQAPDEVFNTIMASGISNSVRQTVLNSFTNTESQSGAQIRRILQLAETGQPQPRP